MATKKKAAKRPATPNRRHRSEPEPFSAALGARIRELRQEKDISFDALVGLSELGRGYVSELERGLAVPSVLTLCKIADALDVSAVDLLNELCPDRPDRTALIGLTAELSDRGLARITEFARQMRDEELEGES